MKHNTGMTVLLFVPGDRPDYCDKALSSGADALIIDLEDSVAASNKADCRRQVEQLLQSASFGSLDVIVRINSLTSPWGRDDLDMVLRSSAVGTVLLPKAEPEKVKDIDGLLKPGSLTLLCLIETARGVQLAYDTALASSRVIGLMLGAEDLALDMHLRRTAGGEEISYSRQAVALAAHAAGVQPVDTPFLAVPDLEGLRTDTENAKRFGFTAKAAISPRQVEIIREAFKPAPDEIEKAKSIIEAAESARREGRGVVLLSGLMIDEPVIARARQVLRLATGKEVEDSDR